MHRLSRKLRTLLRREDGMTLPELMTAVALLSIVVAGSLSLLNGTQTNEARQISRTTSNDSLRLAFESIDREVRSGNVLYDPAAENYSAGDVTPGMSLRIYTESNAPTRGGTAWCVQWRITSGGVLQERRWVPGWDNAADLAQVTGWRIVASGITNRTEGIAAFTRAGAAENLLNVRLRANDDATKGGTVEVQDAVSGRNTQFFPSTRNCGPSVPDPSLVNPKDNTKVPPY